MQYGTVLSHINTWKTKRECKWLESKIENNFVRKKDKFLPFKILRGTRFIGLMACAEELHDA